ncbi:MAG: 3-isopropylmalate dehydratase [Verrucomicrobia bacterium]|nr:3-isopropylmalate dehydratase [Verrucomicrobiota bacterium]
MSKGAKTITGRVYVLGDNIDTDLIIPAQYLNLVPTIPAEYRKLGSYALRGLPSKFAPFVRRGKEKSDYPVIVAGRNFGCGSSREHAPIALGAAGVKAVVAESYARIFFRNAVATGELYPVEVGARICEKVKTGDEVEIDLSGNKMKLVSSGKSFDLKPIGAVAPVVEAGGLFAYARSTGMIKKAKKAVKKAPAAKKSTAKKQQKCCCCCN